jgi:hypothetical protein
MSVEDTRFPWMPIATAVILALWIPSVLVLGLEPLDALEHDWVRAATERLPRGEGDSELSRFLTRLAWDSTGPRQVAWEVDGQSGLQLSGELVSAVRAPAVAAYLLGSLVFFFLARLILGGGAALLATSLLAVSTPWLNAGNDARPLLVGEALTLLGVLWALALQGRHREVEVAGSTAVRMGLAGALLGTGLLLLPAALATLVTTLLIWLFLALRRARSEATIVPVENPGEVTFFALLGTLILFASASAVAWGAERAAGGDGIAFFSSLFSPRRWEEALALSKGLYRALLSPTVITDRILAVAVPAILAVRVIEDRAGRTWRTAGLVPWALLGLYVFALREEASHPTTLVVPINVPPLFVLGLAWMVLRGLRPGRARRQEYTFVLTWLLVGILLVPFVPHTDASGAMLAATVTLLPAVLLVVARAGRALWETEPRVLARIATLLVAYIPVVAVLFRPLAQSSAAESWWAGAEAMLRASIPALLLGGVALGMLSEILSVRVEVEPAPIVERRRRYRRGKPRGRRPRGRRPHRA